MATHYYWRRKKALWDDDDKKLKDYNNRLEEISMKGISDIEFKSIFKTDPILSLY